MSRRFDAAVVAGLVPAGSFGWFVIKAVDRLDLDAFYATYRADGHGRAAYDPSMMA